MFSRDALFSPLVCCVRVSVTSEGVRRYVLRTRSGIFQKRSVHVFLILCAYILYLSASHMLTEIELNTNHFFSLSLSHEQFIPGTGCDDT